MVLGPLLASNLPQIRFNDDLTSFDIDNQPLEKDELIKDIFQNMGNFWENVYSEKGFFKIFYFLKKYAIKVINTHLKNIIARRKLYIFNALLPYLEDLESSDALPKNDNDLFNMLKKHPHFEVFKINELALIIHSDTPSKQKSIFENVGQIISSGSNLIDSIEKIKNPHAVWKKLKQEERKRLLQKGNQDIKIFSSYMSKDEIEKLTKLLSSDNFNYSKLSQKERVTLEKVITTYSYYKDLPKETLKTLLNRDQKLFKELKKFYRRIKTFSSIFPTNKLIRLSNLFSSTNPVTELSADDIKDFEKAGIIFLHFINISDHIHILPHTDMILMKQIDDYFKAHPIVSFLKLFSLEQLQEDIRYLEDHSFTLDVVDTQTQERLNKEREIFLQIKKDARCYALLSDIEKKLFHAFDSLQSPIFFEQKVMRQFTKNVSYLDFPNPMSTTAVRRTISEYMHSMNDIIYHVREYTDNDKEGKIAFSTRLTNPHDVDQLLKRIRIVKNNNDDVSALIKYFMFPHIWGRLSDQLKQTIQNISKNNFDLNIINIETTFEDISDDTASVTYEITYEMKKGNNEYAEVSLIVSYCFRSSSCIEETIAPLEFDYKVLPIRIEEVSS